MSLRISSPLIGLKHSLLPQALFHHFSLASSLWPLFYRGPYSRAPGLSFPHPGQGLQTSSFKDWPSLAWDLNQSKGRNSLFVSFHKAPSSLPTLQNIIRHFSERNGKPTSSPPCSPRRPTEECVTPAGQGCQAPGAPLLGKVETILVFLTWLNINKLLAALDENLDGLGLFSSTSSLSSSSSQEQDAVSSSVGW